MNVTVDLINASSDSSVPSQHDFQTWGQVAMEALNLATASQADASFELSIRVIDEDESASLNQSYRQKAGATNILSFPFGDMPVEETTFLGDLAICAPVVKREATEQDKTLPAHWAHMTVHGVLHLNDFDHEESSEAEKMENLEISILKTLGYDNPYLSD